MKIVVGTLLILYQTFFGPATSAVKIHDFYHRFDHETTSQQDTTVCLRGQSQSPINILTEQTVYNPSLTPIRLDLNGTADIFMKNDGKSIVVNFKAKAGGNIPIVSGGALPGIFRTKEIHYHWSLRDREGSEHKINCESYEFELHMVNVKAQYFNQATGSFDMNSALKDPLGIAVLGSLIRTGPVLNQNWTIITENLKHVKYLGQEFQLPPVSIDQLRTALPWNTWDYYRYQGSLTTPACNEAVIWTVFSQIVELSAGQIRAFRALKSTRRRDRFSKPLGGNFRPTQELNNRTVYRSFFK